MRKNCEKKTSLTHSLTHRAPYLVAMGQMPDIMLNDEEKKMIVLLELTVPFDSSLESFKAAQV